MKKIFVFSILFLFLFSSCSEKNTKQTKEIINKSGLYLIKIGSQYGYIDKEGKIKINPQFKYAENFIDEIALISVGDKYGYINTEGKIIINPQFDDAKNFINNTARVQIGNKWGTIDKSGKIIINPQFDRINDFSGDYSSILLDNKYGFVNKKGEIIINPQFDYVQNFSNDLAVVANDGRYGFIDKKGVLLIKTQFDYADSFSDNLAVASINNKFGYINPKGNVVIDFQYDEANSFINGLAVIKINDKYGYINKKGDIVINPQFDYAQDFQDGLAVIKTGDKYGYINKEGEISINPQFDYVDNFQNNLGLVKIGNKYGYIDKKGTIVINPQFDYADSFSDNIALISLGNKYGYIDQKGKIVINPQFDYANASIDTKKIAKKMCDCNDINNNIKIRTYKVFIDSFSTKGYLRRIDAKNDFSSISNILYNDKNQSERKIRNEYQHLKNKFNNDNAGLNEFDLAYNKNINYCSSNNDGNTLYDEINRLIEAIKDPEPDASIIKGDLLGHSIPGWSFDYLSEFKKFKIINTTKNNSRIEYDIEMELFGENSKSIHDCKIKVIYNLGNDGWNYNNVKMSYITYTNTYYPDKWTKIIPLKNCKWNAENKFKMGWKTRNSSYARITETGPNLGAKTLPNSNTYYIKSLENKVIKVKFTYRPN